MPTRNFLPAIIGFLLLIGSSAALAQDDDGTGCYPRARESLRRFVTMDLPSDETVDTLPNLPLLPVAPAPEPGSPAADPEAWGAAFYRFPLIPAEPGPTRDALIAEFGMGTVVNQTVDSEAPTPGVDTSVPIVVPPGTVVRSRPGSFGEITGVTVNDTNGEALVKDPTGYYLGVRLADGTTGWVFIPELGQPVQGISELQTADPWGVHYSILPPISCNLPNGLVIQTPEDTPLSLAINNLLTEIDGTAIFTALDTSGDGAPDTMFITVADGQVTTRLTGDPFTMTSIRETLGLELDDEGNVVGYTGLVPSEEQQRDILVNAAFACRAFTGFFYLPGETCNTISELPLNFEEFIGSIQITETVVEEETETAPDVPGLEETEVVAAPELPVPPSEEDAQFVFVDPLEDMFACGVGTPIAATESSRRADLSFINVIPDINTNAPSRRYMQVVLSPQLIQDIDNNRENFAIFVYMRTSDGGERVFARRSHSGRVDLRGEIVNGQVVPGTNRFVALDDFSVDFYVPDDVIEMRIESYVEEVPNTPANLCDRYPSQGYEGIGVAEVM